MSESEKRKCCKHKAFLALYTTQLYAFSEYTTQNKGE